MAVPRALEKLGIKCSPAFICLHMFLKLSLIEVWIPFQFAAFQQVWNYYTHLYFPKRRCQIPKDVFKHTFMECWSHVWVRNNQRGVRTVFWRLSSICTPQVPAVLCKLGWLIHHEVVMKAARQECHLDLDHRGMRGSGTKGPDVVS